MHAVMSLENTKSSSSLHSDVNGRFCQIVRVMHRVNNVSECNALLGGKRYTVEELAYVWDTDYNPFLPFNFMMYMRVSEMKCYRRMFRIPQTAKDINVNSAEIGAQNIILNIIKTSKNASI